jgi:hypothetical protein
MPAPALREWLYATPALAVFIICLGAAAAGAAADNRGAMEIWWLALQIVFIGNSEGDRGCQLPIVIAR